MAGATRAWYWHLIDSQHEPEEITINCIQGIGRWLAAAIQGWHRT